MAARGAAYASIWLSLLDNLKMQLTAGGRTILLGETDAGGPGGGFACVNGWQAEVPEVVRRLGRGGRSTPDQIRLTGRGP